MRAGDPRLRRRCQPVRRDRCPTDDQHSIIENCGDAAARQHAGLHRAARTLFHDGRQPRQFRRQPRSRQRRRLSCRRRISSAAPQFIFFSTDGYAAGGRSGNGRSRIRFDRLLYGDPLSMDDTAGRRSRAASPSSSATTSRSRELLTEALTHPSAVRAPRQRAARLRAARIPRRPGPGPGRRRAAVAPLSRRGGRRADPPPYRSGAPRGAGRGGARRSGWARIVIVSAGEDAAGRARQPERAGRCLRGGDRRALSRWRARRPRARFVERWWEARLAALGRAAARPQDRAAGMGAGARPAAAGLSHRARPKARRIAGSFTVTVRGRGPGAGDARPAPRSAPPRPRRRRRRSRRSTPTA